MKNMNIFFLTILTAGLTGCLNADDLKNSSDGQARGYDVNQYPINKLVCDPLGGGSEQGLVGGLKADLYYLENGQSFTSVKDVIANGRKADQFYFFSQVNVPTRLFSNGFPLQTGGLVKDNNGNDLVENFALRFRSILRLGASDTPGYYQLAVLSDDGSVLKARNDQGNYVEVVNNDGNHPTRFGCGTAIYMDQNSEIPISLEYAQGPRHHISVIPMWRKVADPNNLPTEAHCGLTGNETWFNYQTDGSPKKPYNDLLARGWRPIAAANYLLPITALFNPCTEGQPPKISNYQVRTEDSRIIATWTTDIPATSQIRYINQDSGADVLTTSDNILRTQHEVSTGIVDPGPYRVQGASISDTYGKSVTPEADVFVRSQ